MATKKQTVRQEPLLNTVARQLGHAAGTLTRVTQELTQNLSALPEKVTEKVREAATISQPAARSKTRILRAKKKISPAARAHGITMKSTTRPEADKKRKSARHKSPRRRPAA
jgi:hypothetical protein